MNFDFTVVFPLLSSSGLQNGPVKSSPGLLTFSNECSDGLEGWLGSDISIKSYLAFAQVLLERLCLGLEHVPHRLHTESQAAQAFQKCHPLLCCQVPVLPT